MNFATVVVNTPLAPAARPTQREGLAPSLRMRAFTYSIPAHLAAALAVGQLVWVPFGNRRLQGIVVGLSDTSPVEHTREIDEIVDPRPLLVPAQMDLARWIAETYLCSLHDALQLMLPPGIGQRTEILVALDPTASTANLSPRQAALVELLTREGETKLDALPRNWRAAVEALAQRGIVVKRTFLAAPRARPKRVQAVRLVSAEALTKFTTSNPAADVLEFLARGEPVLPTVREVREAVRCSARTLDALADKGWIAIAPALELVALTAKYFAELPALPAAQSRALVYLRERAAPVPVSELCAALKASAVSLRALEAKGYIERTHAEPTVMLKLAPAAALEQARALRGVGRYGGIVDFLRGEPGPVWISAVYAATGCTRRDLQKLEAAGVVALEEQEVWRDSLAGRAFELVDPPKLTPEQAKVWETIAAGLAAPGTGRYLLHGVTGSGKTEIYLRALAQVLAQGRQGIVLVPEISLTPQTIRRFGARFPNRIAVLHSKLALGERYDTWRRCREGRVDVVVGSRSALFAPLPRLGLIVIDEEHDPAYKQEALPHYHARAVALELARCVGATVLLGSATPDLETYHRARRGEFQLLELPKRIMGHARAIETAASEHRVPSAHLAVREMGDGYAEARYLELPPVQVVDLRAELKAGNRSIFSRALEREMARALAAREQVILFLNRRGNATFILCRDCGHVMKCRRCESPMTYHVGDPSLGGAGGQLVCHRCNRRDRVPSQCPNCKSTRIRYFGVGTQRVEEEVRAIFPKARTLRWDYDVTRGKESHEEILTRFVQHQADVLIGTQMIAKGLDLPLVTLVGVISADTALNFPDYASAERTFQLLTQVAGRAGRSILGGKVILQTYNPEHYAIQAASRHDYRAFYEREIGFRREQGYPPLSRLVRLLYVNASEKRCQEESARLQHALTLRIAQLGLPGLDLIGPAPAFFHRVRGEYRYQLLVRGRDPHALLADIALPLGWRVDVDPVSVL